MINYYLLIKPGIILGNLMTFSAGFILASRSGLDWKVFLTTLLGLGLIIASACVFNNYIDRKADREMDRTKTRALAAKTIQKNNALLYGTVLGLLGNGILLIFTNLLTLGIANAGFFIYVCIYSLIKSRTVLSTLIGSIAGAIPPVVGYTAISDQLDMAAYLLFFILVFWQMPHFFSIGLWRYDDYARAKLPILPISKGIFRTKIHIALYIVFFIPIVSLLTLFGYTGFLFLSVTVLIGIVWLLLSLKGFDTDDSVQWGKHMFQTSLVMINAICIMILIDKFI